MSTHSRQDLEQIGRLARARFSHAHMSDTKWRKVFVAVNKAGLRPQRIITKFIDVETARQMRWPGMGAVSAPSPWIDTAEFGPIELRSIEWLLIPHIYLETRGSPGVPAREVGQDVHCIQLLLASLGQFPIELSTEGLRIIGYT